MNDWRPIETAPRDGGKDHPFLAWNDPYWRLCYWSDLHHDWVDYWDGDPAFVPPTHWMPLPKPPTP